MSLPLLDVRDGRGLHRQIVPGGTSDIDEVLRLGRIDFGVDLVPALYQWKGKTHTEGRYHTVRDDTGTDLGIVGRNYEVIQNRPCTRPRPSASAAPPTRASAPSPSTSTTTRRSGPAPP
ncbi:hypothetical protein GR925_22295 [Streptomyces sp. HUCO-GS316]|uniref:hypothetical protein n=1 Tax=Streptomyces sp. HUCO-GS316 TaxID=2692198 RepID=UPI00136BF4A8|nr:hypothetical protein [Streptomyces sp. HUCO-GS316]MXM66104.1 hypothetical protein [Streptomyces sp. HUCO-GS316]